MDFCCIEHLPHARVRRHAGLHRGLEAGLDFSQYGSLANRASVRPTLQPVDDAVRVEIVEAGKEYRLVHLVITSTSTTAGRWLTHADRARQHC